MSKISTTKLTIEIEVQTYRGPESALMLIQDCLKCPAVKSIEVINGKTNFVLHQEPSEEFKDITKLFNVKLENTRTEEGRQIWKKV